MTETPRSPNTRVGIVHEHFHVSETNPLPVSAIEGLFTKAEMQNHCILVAILEQAKLTNMYLSDITGTIYTQDDIEL